MYKTLLKISVGMNLIESEAMRMIKECVVGPTGHQLLVTNVEGGGDEEDPAEVSVFSTSQDRCWRDPKLVRKLTSVRIRTVTAKLRQARKVLADELRYLAVTCPKTVVGQAWQEVRDARRKSWNEESLKRQQQIDHLTQKMMNCATHKTCREIDELMRQKKEKNVKIQCERAEKILREEPTQQEK